MNHEQIIRAWKDKKYRLSLSEAEREKLPQHPSGVIHVEDYALRHVGGAEEAEATRAECSAGLLCPTALCIDLSSILYCPRPSSFDYNCK